MTAWGTSRQREASCGFSVAMLFGIELSLSGTTTSSAFPFAPVLHFLGMIVVGECVMDVGQIKLIVGRYVLRPLALVDHPISDVEDADASVSDPKFAIERIIG